MAKNDRINIRIDSNIKADFIELAETSKRTMTELIEKWITKAVKKARK